MKTKTANKKILVFTISVLFLLGMISAVPTFAASEDVPLNDMVRLTTYYTTAVNYDASKTDYMLYQNQWFSTMGESIWADYGETAAGTGTSYVDLASSCMIGDYAGETLTWGDYAFIESTYAAAVTATGDSAWVVGTNCTAPSLSAGATATYISLQMAGDASSDGGSTAEAVTWTGNIHDDIDNDGVDDSATVFEEDYLKCSANVFLYYCIKVVSSDVDVATSFWVQVSFYVDQSTTYDVKIEVNGGSDVANSYVSDWTYTGANAAELDYFEAEGHAIAGFISIAELISDDSDSTPNIAGVDYVKAGITAVDNYGDGSSDTINGYIYNLCLLDEEPALTDNDPSQTVDWTGGADNAAVGDATYYVSSDCLFPYVVAASANAYNSYVYLDADFDSGDTLLQNWHHIKFLGTAKLDYSSDSSITTSMGEPPNKRVVDLNYNFNQLRISDGDEITSSFAPAYSAAAFYITTDQDDFWSPEKQYDEDLIYAEVAGVEKTEDFEQALANVADNTHVAFYTWSTAPSAGIQNVHYEYYTEESKEFAPPVFKKGLIAGNITLIIGMTAILLGALGLYLRRKNK